MPTANKITPFATKNINKVNQIESKNISKISGIDMAFSEIPAGLIIFLNDSVVPSGWESFSAADGKALVGATGLSSGSYKSGDVGGSLPGATFSNSGTTSSSGSHTGSTDLRFGYGGGTANSHAASITNRAGGDHNHSYSSIAINNVDKNEYKLIKAVSDQGEIPTNGAVLSTSPITGLGMTALTGNNNLLGANSSVGSTSKSSTVALSSAGSHMHADGDSMDDLSGGYQYTNILAGGHSPSFVNATINYYAKRLLLSLWSNATANVGLESGMIGMWESNTIPDGWNLCDGTNGTPNLRENFIQNCASGSENTTSQGNNTLNATYSGSFTDNMTHGHDENYRYVSYKRGDGYHLSASWSHNHTISFNRTFAYFTRYYCINFIMKAA